MLKFFSKFNKICCISLLSIVILAGILIFFSSQFVFIGKYVEAFLSLIDTHSNGIIAISTLLGLIFGSSWLNTSKKKMRGKLDYDIARKYLKSVLKIRDAIKIVRNPYIPVREMKVALEKNGFKGDGYEDYEDKEKVNRSVYSLRLNNVQGAWTNFEEILVEAEISWGEEATNIQKDLDKLIRELRSVVWLFVNYPVNFHEKTGNDEIIHGTHDENDQFAQKINTEIEKIRNFLKKHL